MVSAISCNGLLNFIDYTRKFFSYLMWSVCSLLISLLGVFANLLISQYDQLKYLETLWKKKQTNMNNLQHLGMELWQRDSLDVGLPNEFNQFNFLEKI